MHIPHPFPQVNQRGDTIVEVLIALAIISSVLTGAFFVTNRSSQNVRDTEEHAQALQLLQSQVEHIRADVTNVSTPQPDSHFYPFFCYDTAGQIQQATSATDFSQCPNDFAGTSGAVYKFVVTKTPYTVGTTTTFTATVQWEGLHGQTNNEQLLYKIEPAGP